MGVFDEQPIPDSLATRCGGIESSKQAWTIAADNRIVAASRRTSVETAPS